MVDYFASRGYALEQDRDAGPAAGVNNFLAMPIDAVQLLAVLAKWTWATAGPPKCAAPLP